MATISVIVPVYKVEPYLRRCVDSILAQIYRDFELILVDDGSPDRCGEICDEYAAKDSRVVVIHQKNGGLSAARNAGIDWAFANSNSEYLAFIDSDDWIEAGYLGELLRGGENCEVSCMYFEGVTQLSAPSTVPRHEDVIWESMAPRQFWITRGWTIAWAKLYKKELFANIRYPVGHVHEDEFVTHRVLFRANTIAVSGARLYKYFQRQDGIMGSGGSIDDKVCAVKDQVLFFSGIGDDELVKAAKRKLLDIYVDAVYLGHGYYRKELRLLLDELHLDFLQNRRVFLAAYPLTTVVMWYPCRVCDMLRRRGLRGAFCGR